MSIHICCKKYVMIKYDSHYIILYFIKCNSKHTKALTYYCLTNKTIYLYIINLILGEFLCHKRNKTLQEVLLEKRTWVNPLPPELL